jgi:hypothetical protein
METWRISEQASNPVAKTKAALKGILRPPLLIYLCIYKNRDSSVGIATGYGLDDRGVGVRVPVGSKIFSSPGRPDQVWGPHNLLSNAYQE